MAELADALDSGSSDHLIRAGSSPVSRTKDGSERVKLRTVFCTSVCETTPYHDCTAMSCCSRTEACCQQSPVRIRYRTNDDAATCREERMAPMTELEKMQRAKMYIDKLANGINPIDDKAAAESDIINNVRLSRCLFYVSDILRQLIANGGIVKAGKSAPKPPFFLTDEQKDQYIPSDKPIPVSDIAKALNAIAGPEQCRKLSYASITNWLIHIGALEMQNGSDGKMKKLPTPHGAELGIENETRSGMYGEYQVNVYSKDAQRLIVDNIEVIVRLHNGDPEKAADNHGQAWTPAQEECLIELFRKNVPVSEIAVTLMRTEAGILARLKKLGLIEKRSEK